MLACGIDLGTTNSAIALDRDGRIALVPTREGGRLLPSAVHLDEAGRVLTGAPALERGATAPAGLFRHWKRELSDPLWSRSLNGKVYGAVHLSSLVLKRLLDNARSSLRASGSREEVRDAVVTVPAYFGDLERGATLDAARVAGLDRPRVLNEPTAAALAFGLDPTRDRAVRRALCYDLGGGTFDVTVVELGERTVRVLATAGEHRLGGKDWDDELCNLVAERAYETAGQDPRESDALAVPLRFAVERAKHQLSVQDAVDVSVPLPVGEPLAVRVTRDAFEARTRGLLEQTEALLSIVLDKARLRWADLDAVLPVGGATRMPMVQALLRRVTGREPLRLVDPDEAVARGACAYARLIAGGSRVSEEVLDRPPPASDLVGLLPGVVIKAASPLDFDADSQEFPLLPGAVRRAPEVTDVVSHGLGVLLTTKGGFKNFVLIPEQTPVPAERKKVFRTVNADQTKVQVKVLEGEAADPDGCSVLGTLVVDGLPAGRPKGQRIEVSYTYDEDGRVQVAAKDVASGKAARATFARRGALGKDELARLRAEVAGAAT